MAKQEAEKKCYLIMGKPKHDYENVGWEVYRVCENEQEAEKYLKEKVEPEEPKKVFKIEEYKLY